MKRKSELGLGKKIVVSVFVLAGLAVVASVSAAVIMLFGSGFTTGNVALIPLEGVIVSGTGVVPSGFVSSDTVLKDLQRAEDDAGVEGVVLLINSPGGSAVASDEIAEKVASLEKPVVAVIREVGASGAYWVASSADHVIANRMSITGSLGVLGSYVSFGRFLREWNLTYNRLVAGEMKDVGTPFREPTPEEQAFLEERLEMIHEFFLSAVAENRNLTVAELRPIADGRFLLGSEALAAGLVDELGGKEEALSWLEERLGITAEPVLYEHKRSLLEVLSTLEEKNPFGLAVRPAVPMAR